MPRHAFDLDRAIALVRTTTGDGPETNTLTVVLEALAPFSEADRCRLLRSAMQFIKQSAESIVVFDNRELDQAPMAQILAMARCDPKSPAA